VVEHTKIETQVQYQDRVVEHVVVQREAAKVIHSVRVVVRAPDGTTTSTTTTDASSHFSTAVQAAQVATSASSTTQVSTKTVTPERPNFAIEVAGTWRHLGVTPDAWSAQVQRRVLGPLWLGAGVAKDSAGVAPVLTLRAEF